MLQDLRFGIKLLLKHRGFTIAALVTLALCIGANTAIFTVLDSVVLRGLPFSEPDRLVTLYNIYPGVGVTDRGANGGPDYLDRRKMKDVFSEVAMLNGESYDAGPSGSPRRINGQTVTPSFFRVLRVRPVLGRAFTEEEGVPGSDNVAILSEGLWKEMFARDPGVIGRDIRLSGIPRRIVGVMPDRAGLLGDSPRLWTPLAFTPQQLSDDARHSNSWGMVARLQPGVSVALAKQRIDALNRANLDRFPKYREVLINARFGTRVVSLKDEMVRDIRPTLYLLQAAVALVLLIGCVNLANLMLIRSTVRMKELAIRFSLGARRWRLGRQMLTESVLLAVLGGALGVAVAAAGVRLLSALGTDQLPRGGAIHIDLRVLAFTALTAIITGLIFGSVPLVHVLRRDLNEVFRGNERGGTAGHHALWVRSALVVSQVALAFVLLIGSGLLTLSFLRLLDVDPGFHAGHVVTAQVSLPDSRYKDDARARSFIASVLETLRNTPGVRDAGATTCLPFGGNDSDSAVSIVGRTLAPGEVPPVPNFNTIDAGYLPAMGIPVLAGRNFTESDGPQAPKVMLIDEYMAKRYWPNGDALGAKIRRGIDNTDTASTIVGIVPSVKLASLDEKNPVGEIYFPYQQFVPRNVFLVVRAQADSPQLVASIRRQVLQADSELAIFDTKTMPERVAASLLSQRAAMTLCLIFGALALLLSAVGIYGVLAYSVTQRTREFGIRVALGAGARDVVGMVVGNGLKMAGLGLAIGAAGAFLLTRFMTALLYGVRPGDPSVFAGVALILAAVATLASLIPSLRALRIRPSTALRYE
jgi:predicted permease